MILIAITLLTSALLQIPATPPPEEPGESRPAPRPLLPADTLVARGESLLDRADRESVRRAEEIFRRALDADPNGAGATAGLARTALFRYGRRWEEDDSLIDRALEQARKAVSLGPGDPRAHAVLAMANLVAEDGNGAIVEAERAWALRTPETPPWVTEAYAQVLIACGDRDAALRVLGDAISSRPDRFQIHYLFGNAHLDQAGLDEAVNDYKRVYLLEPDYTPALLQLAYTYDRLEMRDLSAAVYDDIIRRFPEEKGRVYTRMAASLISSGKYREALVGLGLASFKTRRGLGEGTVVYLEALCREKLGEREEARARYRRVIDEFPLASYGTIGNSSLATSSYEALARMALADSRQDEAVRLMEEAMARERPTITLFLELARVYGDYGLHAEAARILKRASGIAFGPREEGPKVAIYVAWARALRAQQAAAPSMAEALDALARNASAIAARGQIVHLLEAARACALLGSTSGGIEWIRRALERGYAQIEWIGSDPEMKSIAKDPAFASLVEAAGKSRGVPELHDF